MDKAIQEAFESEPDNHQGKFNFLINTAATEFDIKFHTEGVFRPPKFDIIDFKNYMPQDEYESLIKMYYDYTRGNTDESKIDFLRENLLGHTIEKQIENKIDYKLRNLYEKLGYDIKDNVAPGELFGPITSEDFSSGSSYHNAQL